MTDLEITRLCAEAMGLTQVNRYQFKNAHGQQAEFTPLHDDAQAMALVKKFHLHIGKTLRTPDDPFGQWVVSKTSKADATGKDLNRAICECVAKMQSNL